MDWQAKIKELTSGSAHLFCNFTCGIFCRHPTQFSRGYRSGHMTLIQPPSATSNAKPWQGKAPFLGKTNSLTSVYLPWEQGYGSHISPGNKAMVVTPPLVTRLW